MLIRPATIDEVGALETLIAASARGLGDGFYEVRQTEAAIAHVFGVDSELIADRSYLVACEGRTIVGCGGWSRRRTLFGGDRFAARERGLLAPGREAARIRAFFVDPAHARRGIGAALLLACEQGAAAAGFRATALMATLPGVPFYRAQGYVAQGRETLDLDGIAIDFVPMTKALRDSESGVADMQQISSQAPLQTGSISDPM